MEELIVIILGKITSFVSHLFIKLLFKMLADPPYGMTELAWSLKNYWVTTPFIHWIQITGPPNTAQTPSLSVSSSCIVSSLVLPMSTFLNAISVTIKASLSLSRQLVKKPWLYWPPRCQYGTNTYSWKTLISLSYFLKHEKQNLCSVHPPKFLYAYKQRI